MAYADNKNEHTTFFDNISNTIITGADSEYILSAFYLYTLTAGVLFQRINFISYLAPNSWCLVTNEVHRFWRDLNYVCLP